MQAWHIEKEDVAKLDAHKNKSNMKRLAVFTVQTFDYIVDPTRSNRLINGDLFELTEIVSSRV